jgi:hypothetical protein
MPLTQLRRCQRRIILDNFLRLNILPDGSHTSTRQLTENKSHMQFQRSRASSQVIIFQDFADNSLFRRNLEEVRGVSIN